MERTNNVARANGVGPRRAGPLAATLLLAAVLLFTASCSKGSAEQKGRPRMAAPVMAAEAVEKDVAVELSAVGSVEAYNTVAVKSRIGGYLQEAHFAEGRDVKQGELLFTIDPAPYEAALKQAKANLAKDQAQLRYARATAKHDAELLPKGLVGREEYEQSRANAQALTAMAAADRAAVELAQLDLGYCSITAPISGRVGSILVKKGNLVIANDPNKALVVIVQVQPIYVSFAVPAQYYGGIKGRMAREKLMVEARLPHGDQPPEPGELTFMDNMVDESTGTLLLKATFANGSKNLWPGAFMSVKLKLSTLRNAVVVPTEAVMTGQSGRFVFVIKPDLTVEQREVAAGYESGGETVIEKGLSAGEQVVTDGQLRLTDGAKVMVKGAAREASPEPAE
ncbi:MAG TPA: efflux RND transporter periplasmic adaptor subunit [bacterium]|nr:efflux RND transporter periplasmic adaptor subunit [bacterium]